MLWVSPDELYTSIDKKDFDQNMGELIGEEARQIRELITEEDERTKLRSVS